MSGYSETDHPRTQSGQWTDKTSSLAGDDDLDEVKPKPTYEQWRDGLSDSFDVTHPSRAFRLDEITVCGKEKDRDIWHFERSLSGDSDDKQTFDFSGDDIMALAQSVSASRETRS